MNKDELLEAILYNKEKQTEYKEEIQVLTNKINNLKNDQIQFEQQLIKEMQNDGVVAEKISVEDNNLRVSWQENPPKVVVHSKESIPDEFIKEKQYTQQTINKSELKKYLEEGNKCNFASLEKETKLKIVEV